MTGQDRLIVGYANYPGDVRSRIDDTQPFGPGYDGELRWPVDAEYDPETNRTKVGFTLVPPAGAVS